MVLILVIIPGAFADVLAVDDVEFDVYKTLQLDATPIDMALAPDGRRIFVLTDKGEVLIFTSGSKQESKVDVGKHIDQIKSGPRGETLILMSSKNKTVQVVTLDFIQQINTSGAPFKGPADAPVVVAVFDDFE